MTDAEIIKALECCYIYHQCEGCPRDFDTNGKTYCMKLGENILDLINRQKAEIEKLKKIQQRQADLIIEERGRRYELAGQFTTAKPEVIKEFAEKLKQKFNVLEYEANTTRKTLATDVVKRQMDWVIHEVTTSEIDNLVNEMI